MHEQLDEWLHNLLQVAVQEFGLPNWTIESLRIHFAGHFANGLTPYQALKKEGYESIN
jgi:hypothetical protein